MKVYQIISENTVADFKNDFAALTPQDQEAFKKLIAWEPSDTPNGTSQGIEGKLYTWSANKKRWIDSNGREVPPESPRHFRLFDEDVSDDVIKLYIEVRKAGEVENLHQELAKNPSTTKNPKKSSSANKTKKSKGGKKSRIGNLVRDMQRATGRKGPSKDPGDGPD